MYISSCRLCTSIPPITRWFHQLNEGSTFAHWRASVGMIDSSAVDLSGIGDILAPIPDGAQHKCAIASLSLANKIIVWH